MLALILRCFALIGFFCSLPLQAEEITGAKATLGRSSNPKIKLSFKLVALDASDLQTYEISQFNQQDGINVFLKFLDICVGKKDDSNKKCSEDLLKVSYPSDSGKLDLTPELKRSQELTATFIDNATYFEETDNGETRALYTSIEITSSNAALPFSTNSTVSLRLATGRGTEANNFKEIEAIPVNLAVAVNDEPDLTLQGSFRSLTAIWPTDKDVDLEDGNKGRPDGVLIFALPLTDENRNRSFPIRSYNKADVSQEKDIPNACRIVEGSNNTCNFACESLPEGKYYLTTEILKSAGIDAREINDKDNITFSDVSLGQNYAVIIQYLPDGLQRSCRIGQSADAVTLSDLNGGPPLTAKDPRCFIATAAYGSPLDARLDTLRWFRDRYLLSHQFGQNFVRLYYRYSPALAAWIEPSPLLRAMARTILWPLTHSIEQFRFHPWWAALEGLSLCLGLAALSLFLRRKTKRVTPLS